MNSIIKNYQKAPINTSVRKLVIAAGMILLSCLTGCTSLQGTRLETDPSHSANMIETLELANKAYASKNWLETERHYRKLVAMMDKDEFSRFRLANSLLRQGRLQEAVVEFTIAVELNPQFVEARHNLSTAYILLAQQQLTAMEQLVAESQRQAVGRKKSYLEEAAASPL